MVPGIKADIALILIGLQGAGKSTAVAAMSPFDDWFCELDLSADDDKKARMLRGKVIAEFGEMRGMYAREVSHIKAFMTKQFEEWVPKFIEYTTRYYRRTVFVGTSNEDEVLADRTGNRRWAPVRVGAVDVDAIRKDCVQLWAEAVQMFEAEGILYQEVQTLAESKHAEHMQEDLWRDTVARWLDEENVDGVKNGTRKLKLMDVISGALLIDTSKADRKVQIRVADVMRDLGFEKTHSRAGSVWEKRDFE
jgi:predicted P-loop ATPase